MGERRSSVKLYICKYLNIVSALYTTIRLKNLLKVPEFAQLVKKFPAFYRKRMLITAFTTLRLLSLSTADQSSPCPLSHFLEVHFNFLLPSTPRSYKSSLSPRFPHQNLPLLSYVLHDRQTSFCLIWSP
jgi:hypothetical protein